MDLWTVLADATRYDAGGLLKARSNGAVLRAYPVVHVCFLAKEKVGELLIKVYVCKTKKHGAHSEINNHRGRHKYQEGFVGTLEIYSRAALT